MPTLQEDESIPQAYAEGNFPNGPQPRYNPSWRDHPNLRYGNLATSSSQQHPKQDQSLKDIVKSMATMQQIYQQRTDATIQDIRTQIGQLASFVSKPKTQGSGLPPS